MVATFFVGSLFGVGLFLSFYKGSSRQDRILAVIWGLAAIFIGLIPMNPCNDPDLPNLCVDPGHTTYHFVPVAVFFAINIYIALLKAAADTALQRFRDAVARHAEEQRRREKREWVIATAPVKLPYDLPLAERDAALAAARRAVDQHPEHADRRELEAARDRALEPFVTAHERRGKIGSGPALTRRSPCRCPAR